MRLTLKSPSADEQGQASLLLLIGMMLSLLALMLLFIRLGDAHQLRSRARLQRMLQR